MQKQTKVMKVILLLGIAILSSCISVREKATNFPTTPVAVQVTTSLPPTIFAEGSISSPSIDTTSNPTQSLINTQTVVVLPTATWVTVLPKTEAEEMAIKLLRDNGGCRLPCFWGFVPQQTSQDKVNSFFHAFNNIGGSLINIPRGNSIIKISSTWNYNDNPKAAVRILWVTMTAEREVKLNDGHYDQNVFNNLFFHQFIQYYTLPHLLSNYGSPVKAYIGIDLGAEMGFDNLLHLYLDYSESGWSVQFIMPVRQSEHSFIGCPQQAFTSLSLWSPEEIVAASENQAEIDEYGIFKPLEEVSSFSLEEFYQQFKDPDNIQCLETPAEIWLTSK